jgi:hypothetical protein
LERREAGRAQRIVQNRVVELAEHVQVGAEGPSKQLRLWIENGEEGMNADRCTPTTWGMIVTFARRASRLIEEVEIPS